MPPTILRLNVLLPTQATPIREFCEGCLTKSIKPGSLLSDPGVLRPGQHQQVGVRGIRGPVLRAFLLLGVAQPSICAPRQALIGVRTTESAASD